MRHSSIKPAEAGHPYGGLGFAIKTILVFWLIYLVTVLVRAGLSGDFSGVVMNRAPTMLSGMVLTFGIYLVIHSVREGSGTRRRAIVATIASISAAILQGIAILIAAPLNSDTKAEYRVQAREGAVIVQKGREIKIERNSGEPLVFTLPKLNELGTNEKVRFAADAAVVWLFFFAAWSAVYIAGVSAGQVAVSRRRLAEAEAAEQAAQVRALRYQVNPHFLFNTLNSLSSLIMSGRHERAESMLMALSTFFRTSLSLDPAENVTLAEEIDLQRLYLEIEKARFPERLTVEIEVPDDVAKTRVPALILQPIVENAIKYGVSTTRANVTIKIHAERLFDGRVQIDIVNSMPEGCQVSSRPRPAGTGTGLTNVCQRLAAQFGSAADCRFGPIEGGFKVSLAVPSTVEEEDDD
ncbi:sensor histidine kinase [Sphingomicrobium lutaoense]|uniref:Two-component sensor histidine kinase n=1 Tax=Sphingomicrobium lutaoense TaxID=515949 RepID=A0A839Z305_9SPHN|nr:histidine kinase [Sphingomicrobium lutaoense]MBB3764143.1 two-component sensor histidine kinase [Sphingomicrobium lutaoense]